MNADRRCKQKQNKKNARDYTKVIILEALIRDGKVSKLGNFILERAHWINPSVGQSRVALSHNLNISFILFHSKSSNLKELV